MFHGVVAGVIPDSTCRPGIGRGALTLLHVTPAATLVSGSHAGADVPRAMVSGPAIR